MTKNLIRVGERYATRNGGDFWGKIVMEIVRVENPTSLDGLGYYDTEQLLHGRKHHSARIWWFKDFCRRIEN